MVNQQVVEHVISIVLFSDPTPITTHIILLAAIQSKSFYL